MKSEFFNDYVPEEIQSWHDYYQGIIAEMQEVINGYEKGDTIRASGSNDETRGESRSNPFNSKCSRCGK